MNRRHFLRAAGLGIALPGLPSLMPRAEAARLVAGAPKRLVFINASMGILPKEFFPTGVGAKYESSRYLSELAPFREKMSVFSGLSHPEVDGGHHADVCYLTGSGHPGSSGFQNTISVDQFAAEKLGNQTRFASLVLHAGSEGHKNGISYTQSGVAIPAEDSVAQLYRKLFLKGNEAEVEARLEELKTGRSILDTIHGRATSMGKKANSGDRGKIDEYLTSVRELEQRLVLAGEWEKRSKPDPGVPAPVDISDQSDVVGRSRLMYDMMKLALQTDSTRVISLKIHSYNRVLIDGVNEGHHSLTHHGGREEALKQLRLIELARLREFRDFLTGLSEVKDNEGSLLDSTAILYGSHLGDANRHTNTNLPLLVAGGNLKHGSHHSYNSDRNQPLAKLFVSMMQGAGIEVGEFAGARGTLTGI